MKNVTPPSTAKMWKVLDSGTIAVQKAMDRDGAYLKAITPQDDPFIHFYDFDGPSATCGYFIRPFTLLNEEGVQRQRLSLGKRVTGGGIIFHLCDLPFSILLPKGHPGYQDEVLGSYQYLNNLVAEAIRRFVGGHPTLKLLPQKIKPVDEASGHFCMAGPTIYDVLLDGKKVAGAAMRRLKNGLLYHGSITLGVPLQEFLDDVLLPGTCVSQAMQDNSYPLLGDNWTWEQMKEARKALKGELCGLGDR